MSIWRAKNEPVELIIGNLMIAIGGFLIGYKSEQTELSFLSYLSPMFIVLGIFFDVRVLKKFSHELRIIKNEVDSARSELHSTVGESQNIKNELNSAKIELNQTIYELRRTEKEIHTAKSELKKAERELKDTQEKLFGTSGGVFSKFSWARPMEEKINELERQIKDLGEKIRDLERGHRF